MLTWEGFADDMEKFRGNLGRGKVRHSARFGYYFTY